MLDFIVNNLATIIISLVLVAIIATVVIFQIKNKKQGKTSCGCGCQNCAMHGECHKH